LIEKLQGPFFTHDFFQPKPHDIPEAFTLIANPPYGERIEIDDIQSFQNNLWQKIFNLSPQKALILVPKLWKRYHHDCYVLKTLAFSNGGLDIEARLYIKKGKP
jgi:23S rRNA G2445 N2-methylase RlmL